jgi:predicted MFS family arabinose efflux permease
LAGVYLASTLFELAEGALRFLLPLDLASRGIQPEGIGFVMGVFAFTSLLSRAVVGAVFRHSRASAMIIVAGLASSGAFLALPLADGVAGFALLMAADGFGWGIATTVLLAVMMTTTPPWMSSAVAMGWLVGFQGIAIALATTVGGLLAEWQGVRTAMTILAVVPVMAATLIAIRLPRPTADTGTPPMPDVVDDGEDEDVGGRLPWRGTGGRRMLRRLATGLPAAVWAAALVAAYLNVMNGLLQAFFPLLGLSLGLSIAQVGTLSTVRTGVSSVARFGAGWLFARISPSRLHLPLLTTSAVTVALLPWTAASYLLTLPLFALNGVSRGLMRVTTGAAAMDALQGRRAGVGAALMTAGLDVGKMIGPVLGGLVAGAIGLSGMFVVVPLAFLAISVAALLVARRRASVGPDRASTMPA